MSLRNANIHDSLSLGHEVEIVSKPCHVGGVDAEDPSMNASLARAETLGKHGVITKVTNWIRGPDLLFTVRLDNGLEFEYPGAWLQRASGRPTTMLQDEDKYKILGHTMVLLPTCISNLQEHLREVRRTMDDYRVPDMEHVWERVESQFGLLSDLSNNGQVCANSFVKKDADRQRRKRQAARAADVDHDVEETPMSESVMKRGKTRGNPSALGKWTEAVRQGRKEWAKRSTEQPGTIRKDTPLYELCRSLYDGRRVSV